MRNTYKRFVWRSTRPVNTANCMKKKQINDLPCFGPVTARLPVPYTTTTPTTRFSAVHILFINMYNIFTTPESKETYIGLCDTTFTERYRNHTCSFRHEPRRNVTELSKHIRDLKNRKIYYETKWRKAKRDCVFGRSFSSFVNRKCQHFIIKTN